MFVVPSVVSGMLFLQFVTRQLRPLQWGVWQRWQIAHVDTAREVILYVLDHRTRYVECVHAQRRDLHAYFLHNALETR